MRGSTAWGCRPCTGWTCGAHLRLEKVHHLLHVFHFEQALLAVQHNAQGHLHVAAGVQGSGSSWEAALAERLQSWCPRLPQRWLSDMHRAADTVQKGTTQSASALGCFVGLPPVTLPKGLPTRTLCDCQQQSACCTVHHKTPVSNLSRRQAAHLHASLMNRIAEHYVHHS